MAGAFLKDLRGLTVMSIVPSNSEGQSLNGHLRRIGCRVTAAWPIPQRLSASPDIVFLWIDDEDIPGVLDLLASVGDPAPTLIAIVNYENPRTLQIVLEHNFFAIIDRPIRSFGLLANLAIARNLWLQHQSTLKELRNYKRRALGDQKVMRAKSILMALKGCSEDEAYRELRAESQATRLPIEAIAEKVIKDEARRTAGASRQRN